MMGEDPLKVKIEEVAGKSLLHTPEPIETDVVTKELRSLIQYLSQTDSPKMEFIETIIKVI